MPDAAERWLPVPGWDAYEVSDRGRVRSRRRKGTDGRVLAATMRGPYRAVDLYQDGRRSHVRVHTLVCEAFIGPCPVGQEVRHLDDDPTNNVLENLAYGTRSDNLRDAYANGKQPSRKGRVLGPRKEVSA